MPCYTDWAGSDSGFFVRLCVEFLLVIPSHKVVLKIELTSTLVPWIFRVLQLAISQTGVRQSSALIIFCLIHYTYSSLSVSIPSNHIILLSMSVL